MFKKGFTTGDIISTLNSKLIKENQYDKYKEYTIFEGPRDGSKQKSVDFTVYDLAN